ncbi:MAG: ABC transporter substrate-binding protein [Alphaproteobacteria bacterium]
MRGKSVSRLVVLAGLAALAAAAASSPRARAETVKVGLVLPLTGMAADVAQSEERAMRLYYKLHKAELGGNDIELIERNSLDPSGATAQTLTRELLAQERVDILAGYQFSPDAIASAAIATQAKKLMILVNAQASFITRLSPYIVRLSAASWQITYPMGGYAFTTLGCKSAIVGYSDFAPGKDVLAAFTAGYEKAGGKLADAVPMGGPAQVPDYTPFLQRIKDQHPDCMYVFTPAASFNPPLARTYHDLGLAEAGVRFLGTGDVTQDSVLPQLGDSAVGWITAGHYTADLDTPENKRFVAAWLAEYGDKTRPDFFTVQGYDAMAAIFHVVKTLDGKIDGDKAVAALLGWKHESPRGPIMIDPETRDIMQNIYVQKVVKDGDRLAIKVIDTIPAVKDPCKALAVGPCAAK